jgi:hypothetical protein
MKKFIFSLQEMFALDTLFLLRVTGTIGDRLFWQAGLKVRKFIKHKGAYARMGKEALSKSFLKRI